MKKLYNSPTGCCPPFNPAPWDRKIITWKNKLFLADHLFCMFFIPCGFGKLMARDMEKIASAHALAKTPILLYDGISFFGADVFIAVSKPVPNASMTRISGTFLSKVFEGDFKNSGNWAKEMEEYAKKQGKKMKQLYFFFTTCPSCAKYYGKNYVVLLGKIK